MDSLHLTRELLRALADRTRNPGDLVSLVMSHLFDLCPTCAAEFRAFRDEVSSGEASSYAPGFERVKERLGNASRSAAAEKAAAEPKLAELLSLPHRTRLEAIQQSPKTYAGPALTMTLLEAARERFASRPQEALDLAELARAVLAHEDISALVVELYAQTLAYTGNAFRVSGDPRAAVERFESCRFLLRLVGGGDRVLRAEIDSLEGSLRRALRETKHSIQLLQRAAMTYFMEEQVVKGSSTLLKLASVHFEEGEPERSLEALDQAEEALASEHEPKLHLYCQHARAICLCETGSPDEAARILEQNQRHYAQYGDPLTMLRVSWVQAKIARKLGHLEEAQFHYLAARHGFLREGIAYDAALVTLELAGVYLEERRLAEVKELAGELVNEFTRQEVSREATAALMLFEDAARMEQITPSFIADISTYLIQAQRDPSLAFQAAS